MNTRNAATVAIATLAFASLGFPPTSAAASGDGCSNSASTVGDFIAVAAECTTSGGSIAPSGVPGSAAEVAFTAYRWVVVCTSPGSSGNDAVTLDCSAAQVCPAPDERLYRLWGQNASTTAWEPLTTRCFGEPPTAADTPRPQVTPALVLTELRRVGLPAVQARTQPEDKTLVNFDTIFYAHAAPVTTTLRLLGQDVTVEATPTTFTWHHGDGTTTITDHPGAPYPATPITHAYQQARITYTPSVEVTYTGRFRVNTSNWQDIGGTVTIPGPPTTLRVAEAVAVLSGQYD